MHFECPRLKKHFKEVPVFKKEKALIARLKVEVFKKVGWTRWSLVHTIIQLYESNLETALDKQTRSQSDCITARGLPAKSVALSAVTTQTHSSITGKQKTQTHIRSPA